MVKFYKIFNWILKIVDFGTEISPYWGRFEVRGDQSADCTISPIYSDIVNRDIQFASISPSSKLMFSGNAVLCTDESYHHAFIYQGGTPCAWETFAAYLFYTHAIRHQILWIHSATIEVSGCGILFLGPSGVGKTTQAERWAQFRGASIINGDVGFVQRTQDGFLAWGTPWHGSSPYCLNTSVPLKALVVLKQAPYNALRELTGFEKLKEVSNNVFYPTWLEDGMELGVEVLNHLLTELPVYRLDNRADLEAVELLERELNRIS